MRTGPLSGDHEPPGEDEGSACYNSLQSGAQSDFWGLYPLVEIVGTGENIAAVTVLYDYLRTAFRRLAEERHQGIARLRGARVRQTRILPDREIQKEIHTLLSRGRQPRIKGTV